MRVLLTSPTMDLGGAERVVCMLARALADRGNEVGLLAPVGPMDSALSDGLSPISRYPCNRSSRNLRNLLRIILQTRSCIIQFRPDVVHSQNVVNTVMVRIARMLAGSRVKIVATFHGTDPSEYRAAAVLLRTADAVVSVSRELGDELKRISPGLARRSQVIYNGVEPSCDLSPQDRERYVEEFGLTRGDGSSRRVVLAVGRLVPQKNHTRYLEAAKIVKSLGLDCVFLVCGEGDSHAELLSKIEELGLNGECRLLGGRSDARKLIAQADVLVFSSDWEGLSIAALEALSCGTPIVTTATAGMREALIGGGGVVTDFDAPALATGIERYLRDPAARAQASIEGQGSFVHRFSLDSMVVDYIRVYKP